MYYSQNTLGFLLVLMIIFSLSSYQCFGMPRDQKEARSNNPSSRVSSSLHQSQITNSRYVSQDQNNSNSSNRALTASDYMNGTDGPRHYNHAKKANKLSVVSSNTANNEPNSNTAQMVIAAKKLPGNRWFKNLARPRWFEHPTFGSGDQHSIQLSYGRVKNQATL